MTSKQDVLSFCLKLKFSLTVKSVWYVIVNVNLLFTTLEHTFFTTFFYVCQFCTYYSASEMTCIVSGGALNSTLYVLKAA